MTRSVRVGAAAAVLLVAGGAPVAASPGDHAGGPGPAVQAPAHGDTGHETAGHGDTDHDDAGDGAAGHGDTGHGDTAQGDTGHGDHAVPEDPASSEDGVHEGGHGGASDAVSPETRASVLGGFGAVNAAAVMTAFVMRRRDRRGRRAGEPVRGSGRSRR